MDQRVEKGVGSHVNTQTFIGNGGDPSGNIVSSLPVGHRVGDRYGVQVGPSWGGDSSRRVGHEQQWNAEGSVASPLGERSGEYEEDDESDSGEGDGEIDGLVPINNTMAKNTNNSSGSVQSSSEKTCHEKLNSHEHHFFLGLMRGESLRDKSNNGRGSMSDQQYQSFRADQYDSPVNIAEPGMCYALPRREDLSALVQKDSGRDNDCMISGRKQFSATNDYGESLRLHLSDPVTGALMDDAMILSCGHSYGNAGIQHVIQMNACFKCGFPASSDTMRPNLALRAAVKAFRREEESKSTKRRRDRIEQERFNRDDLLQMDTSKGKGVQFPFCVSDRVIIKGNKRTPQRFVGRVAVVTTQCLNGWYVVKTLDNAESVKLQYRSLEKFSGDVVPFQHNTAS